MPFSLRGHRTLATRRLARFLYCPPYANARHQLLPLVRPSQPVRHGLRTTRRNLLVHGGTGIAHRPGSDSRRFARASLPVPGLRGQPA